MQISEKIKNAQRITSTEALEVANYTMYELSRLAQLRTKQADSSGEVGYIVNRMINYSNVCMAQCKFCAYHARAGRVEAFTMSDEQIFNLCADAVARGGVQIMLQGGLHPKFKLKWAENLLTCYDIRYTSGIIRGCCKNIFSIRRKKCRINA